MDKFGKYEVHERIGEGGFGEVFKGYDPLIKRSVAIKTCSSDDKRALRRFELEAEISGNLSHRNITTIYDYGLEDGVPYLVQELLDGEDLDRKIKRREDISGSTKLSYLAQIASGLEHSHAKGVVHRDLKPANIHILPDGTAKIMDYGIARLLHQTSDLTRVGQTVGTTAYLAPEQIRGEELDHRVDIFAFGALSYELLTYERAFSGDTITAVMYRIVSQEPSPIDTYWPDCPAELVDHVERCIHKEPDRRPQDFSVIVGELGRMRESSASQELPVGRSTRSPSPPAPLTAVDTGKRTRLIPTSIGTRPTRRKWALVVAAIGVALAVLGTTAWLVWRPDSEPAVSGSGATVEQVDTSIIEEQAAAGAGEEGTAEVTAQPAPAGEAEAVAKTREEASEDIPRRASGRAQTPTASATTPSPASELQANEQPVPIEIVLRKRTPLVVETFSVVSDPAGALIWVDGRQLIPPASIELLQGASYRLRLELEEHKSVDRSLTLESLSPEERSSGQVSVRMERRPPPPVDPPKAEPAATQSEVPVSAPVQSIEPAEMQPVAPPAEEHAPPPSEDPGVARVAIQELLDSYEAAYAALDVVAVRRIWPTIGADRMARLEDSFASLRAAGLSQTVDLDCREPTLDDDRATVSCNQTVTVTSGRRQMNSAETEVDFDLEKVNGSWVIRSLRSR